MIRAQKSTQGPKPKKPKAPKRQTEETELWSPEPWAYADPKGGRTLTDPVYDPYSKSVRPWGEFYHEKKKLDQRHRLRRPDWEHPGEWYDPAYVAELDRLREELPPPAYVRDPSGIPLKPIKSPKDVGKKSEKGLQNILAVLERAEPEEIDYWKHWYGYAHLEAVKLSEAHSRPVDLVAGVIAVLSPKEYWEQNLYLADRALAQDWTNVKALNPSRMKAYSLVVENDFSVIGGGKVFEFFLSVSDPVGFMERVVVDTHAINIWRGVRAGEAPKINDSERRRMAEDYARAGEISGLSPQAVQAITWVLWRQFPTVEGTVPMLEEDRAESWGKGKKPELGLTEEETSEIGEYLHQQDLPEDEFEPPVDPSTRFMQGQVRRLTPEEVQEIWQRASELGALVAPDQIRALTNDQAVAYLRGLEEKRRVRPYTIQQWTPDQLADALVWFDDPSRPQPPHLTPAVNPHGFSAYDAGLAFGYDDMSEEIEAELAPQIQAFAEELGRAVTQWLVLYENEIGDQAARIIVDYFEYDNGAFHVWRQARGDNTAAKYLAEYLSAVDELDGYERKRPDAIARDLVDHVLRYGKVRQLAEQIAASLQNSTVQRNARVAAAIAREVMGVVDWACPHCEKVIHEKFGARWKGDGIFECSACGGEFQYKTDEQLAADRAALESRFPTLRAAREQHWKVTFKVRPAGSTAPFQSAAVQIEAMEIAEAVEYARAQFDARGLEVGPLVSVRVQQPDGTWSKVEASRTAGDVYDFPTEEREQQVLNDRIDSFIQDVRTRAKEPPVPVSEMTPADISTGAEPGAAIPFRLAPDAQYTVGEPFGAMRYSDNGVFSIPVGATITIEEVKDLGDSTAVWFTDERGDRWYSTIEDDIQRSLRVAGMARSAGVTVEPKRPSVAVHDLGLKPNGGVENILAVLRQASPEELEYWAKWYHHASEDVQELAAKYGLPLDVTAAVVATLSPGNKWFMNLRAAEVVIANFVQQSRIAQVRSLTPDEAQQIWEALKPYRVDVTLEQILGMTNAQVGALLNAIEQGHSYLTPEQIKNWSGSELDDTNVWLDSGGSIPRPQHVTPGITAAPFDSIDAFSLQTESYHQRYREDMQDVAPPIIKAFSDEVGRAASAWLQESWPKLTQLAAQQEGSSVTANDIVNVVRRFFQHSYGALNAFSSVATNGGATVADAIYDYFDDLVGRDVAYDLAVGLDGYIRAFGRVQELGEQVAEAVAPEDPFEVELDPDFYGEEPQPDESELPGLDDDNFDDRYGQIEPEPEPEPQAPAAEPQPADPPPAAPVEGEEQMDLFGAPALEEQTAPELAPGINAYPANIEKAEQILATGDTSLVTGPKVTKFFQSLVDPTAHEDGLVLDGHAINIWRGERRPLKGTRQPGKREREKMLADYAEAARQFGIPVQAVQAVTWYVWKHVVDTPQLSLFGRIAFLMRRAQLSPELIQQYEQEWQQGRSLADVLKEVEHQLTYRGPNRDLIKIRDALRELVLQEQRQQHTGAWKPSRCPHCKKNVPSGEIFGEDGRWFHRPCISKGPIGKQAELDVYSTAMRIAYETVHDIKLGEFTDWQDVERSVHQQARMMLARDMHSSGFGPADKQEEERAAQTLAFANEVLPIALQQIREDLEGASPEDFHPGGRRYEGSSKCPHCGEAMDPSDVFGENGRRFHRPCTSRGPIDREAWRSAAVEDDCPYGIIDLDVTTHRASTGASRTATSSRRTSQSVTVGPGAPPELPQPPAAPQAPSVGPNLAQLMKAIADHSSQIANMYDFVREATGKQNEALTELWTMIRRFPDPEQLRDALRLMPMTAQQRIASAVETLEHQASSLTAQVDTVSGAEPNYLLIQVIRRSTDGPTQHIFTSAHATLGDVADVAAAYGVQAPDYDPTGGVVARGANGLEMRVSSIAGHPLDAETRQEALLSMARTALRVRAYWRRAAAFLRAAVSFEEAILPGTTLVTNKPIRTSFGYEVPAGVEVAVEGMHQPDADGYFGLPELGNPIEGSAFDNMRIRLIPLDPELAYSIPEIVAAPRDLGGFDLPSGVGEIDFGDDEPSAQPLHQELIQQYMSQPPSIGDPVMPTEWDAPPEELPYEPTSRYQLDPTGLPQAPIQRPQQVQVSPQEQVAPRAPTRAPTPPPPAAPGQRTQPGRPTPIRTSARRYDAWLEFEALGGTQLEWMREATVEEISRTATHYGIRPQAVEHYGEWIAFHGRPVISKHGSGRFVLRINAGDDAVRVAAALGGSR